MAIIPNFPNGGNAKFPEGGEDGQALIRENDSEAWGYPNGVKESDREKIVQFVVADEIPGDVITIEITDEEAEVGTAAVTSFNGRSGEVVPQAGDYTAEMVGARPDTWTPTAAEVGARPDSWVPTAQEVGAIPAVSGAQGQLLGFTAANTVGAITPESGVDFEIFEPTSIPTWLSKLNYLFYRIGNIVHIFIVSRCAPPFEEVSLGSISLPSKFKPADVGGAQIACGFVLQDYSNVIPIVASFSVLTANFSLNDFSDNTNPKGNIVYVNFSYKVNL